MSNIKLEHKSDEEAKQLLLPLQKMTQLQQLHVHLIPRVKVHEITLSGIRHLQQVGVVELCCGYAKYLCDANMR